MQLQALVPPSQPGVRRLRLFSIGYERKGSDVFVWTLAGHGVDLLVDVRLTPWSRRAGFSKTELQRALGNLGIEYLHEPLLGNPPSNRERFRSGNLLLGRERFRKRLENGSAGAMQTLIELAATRRVAIMCVEEDEERCHRQVIVEALSAASPAVAITRL